MRNGPMGRTALLAAAVALALTSCAGDSSPDVTADEPAGAETGAEGGTDDGAGAEDGDEVEQAAESVTVETGRICGRLDLDALGEILEVSRPLRVIHDVEPGEKFVAVKGQPQQTAGSWWCLAYDGPEQPDFGDDSRKVNLSVTIPPGATTAEEVEKGVMESAKASRKNPGAECDVQTADAFAPGAMSLSCGTPGVESAEVYVSEYSTVTYRAAVGTTGVTCSVSQNKFGPDRLAGMAEEACLLVMDDITS